MSEQVVLLDEAGEAVGAADKRGVHHESTPLHLAFSLYLFDEASAAPRLLLTRRALHKVTWPGMWTNSCCGHPGPGERLEDAVRRRTREELGVDVDGLRLVLPTFRYRAVMPDGVVENEMCPVYVGLAAGDVAPSPDEVDSVSWEPWGALRASILDGSREISPWCREQVEALPEDAVSAAPGSEAALPPAAR